jgi:hypothetical protein
MKSIKQNTDITYMWEDKGPSFTKMRTDQYLLAGEKELRNEKFYEEVEDDPTNQIKSKNDCLINEMLFAGEITEKVAEYLLEGGNRLSKFYHLLKTHNIPHNISDPTEWLEANGCPIRGIISCLSGPTERLAGLVDHYLQPGMKRLQSFLQDTKHTLQLIEETNEKIERGDFSLEGVSLVALDVEKMYNNITEEFGMGACRGYLDSRFRFGQGVATGGANQDPIISTDSLMTALDLCVKHNYFSYGGKIYRQIGGVGTGVKLAPPYACIAMGEFEDRLFENTESENEEFITAIKLWKRFIDDIFMIFKGTEQVCEQFVDWLNSLMPGVIKLKANCSNESLEFLDLKIMIINGRLETDLYIKPTNLQLYLDFTSNHPFHCKSGLVYGQALRIIERCSRAESVGPHLENLKVKLVERNYPVELIEAQFTKAKKKDRKELVFQQRKKEKW